jgi:hypothetical protein
MFTVEFLSYGRDHLYVDKAQFHTLADAARFCYGRRYGEFINVRDDLDLYIDRTVVKQVYDNLPNRYIIRRKSKPYVYRQGPVSGTGRRSGGHYYRYPRTLAERRYKAYMEATDEFDDYRIKHITRFLPSSYDDLPISVHDHKNWKRYRKTQWK